MGHDEMTRKILEVLRRPSNGKPSRLTLSDGRILAVRVAGIECFGELRSVEVIEQQTGEKVLIPYRDIVHLCP